MKYAWIIFAWITSCTQVLAQNQEVRAWERQLDTLKSNYQRIEILNQCAKFYMYAEPQKALALTSEAIQLADSLEDKQGWAYASMYRGETLIQTGVYPQGRSLMEAAIVHFTKLNDSIGKGQALAMLGFCMNSQGQYSEAFNTLHDAYTFLEPQKDLWSIRLWHNNMSAYYYMQGDHVKDMEEIRKALEIAQIMQDTLALGISYYNLALSHGAITEDSLAEVYYRKSLQLAKDIQNTSMIAWNKGAIGELYWYNMQPQKALPLIEEAYDLFLQMDDPLNICYYASTLAFLNVNEDKDQKALQLAQKAVEVAHKTESVGLLSQAYYTLGFIHQKRKEFELALEANKKFHHYQDSLTSQKKMFTLDSLQNAFANKEAELDKHLLQKEIAYQKTQTSYLVAGILLSALFISFLILTNWQLKRKKDEIRKQQEELELAHQNVSIKNEKLESIILERTQELKKTNEILHHKNQELGQFVHMASHEFQQPISLISGYVLHMKSKIENLSREKLDEYLGRIERANAHKREIIRDFLTYTTIARQEIPEPIDCNQILDQTLKELLMEIPDKKIIVDADPLPHIHMNQPNFRLLLYHLLHNAIIHGQDGDHTVHVKISSQYNPTYWEMSVSDKGQGIPKEYQERIFSAIPTPSPSQSQSGKRCRFIYLQKSHRNLWRKDPP